MNIFKLFNIKNKQHPDDDVLGFHVECTCAAVHTRNGKIIYSNNKYYNYILTILNKLRGH